MCANELTVRELCVLDNKSLCLMGGEQEYLILTSFYDNILLNPASKVLVIFKFSFLVP